MQAALPRARNAIAAAISSLVPQRCSIGCGPEGARLDFPRVAAQAVSVPGGMLLKVRPIRHMVRACSSHI